MKKIIVFGLIGLIIVIIMSLLIGSILNTAGNELKKQTTQIESNLGKKIFIDGDSLTITDYSLLNDSYKLSNGTTVSFELVKKLKNK